MLLEQRAVSLVSSTLLTGDLRTVQSSKPLNIDQSAAAVRIFAVGSVPRKSCGTNSVQTHRMIGGDICEPRHCQIRHQSIALTTPRTLLRLRSRPRVGPRLEQSPAVVEPFAPLSSPL